MLAELVGGAADGVHPPQAVAQVGDGLVVSAEAPGRVIEAIESTRGIFAVGVQLHPELLLHSMPLQRGVYRGLVQRARDVRR